MTRDSLLIATAAALMFASTAQAELVDVFIQTADFSDIKYHDIPTLGTTSTVGLILGYICFSFVVIVGGVMVVRDQIQRYQDYLAKIDSAEKRMRELGIDLTLAKSEFLEREKGVKVADDDDNLVDAAEKQDQK